MILRVEVGSTAHGTGLAGREDHDETVVRVERPSEVLGVHRTARAVMERSQPAGVPSGPGDTDRQIYTLRHFLALAVAGNPSIMLVLWAPVIETSPLGDELRSLSRAFVGRHLIPPYRGYMKAQRDRLLGLRGGRHGAFRETDAGYDTKYAMHAARLGAQGIELLTTGQLVLPVAGAVGKRLRDIRKGSFALDDVVTWIDTMDRRLAEFASDETIPATADRPIIEEWSIRAHRTAWGWP
jgi:hypothetical protein